MPTPEFHAMPGWRAIETALAEAFPGRSCRIYRTPRDVDSNDWPLAAVFVHQLDDAWHYCSVGLTDMYEKSNPQSESSGLGSELTFRLLRRPDEEQEPTWPVELLHRIASNALDRHVAYFPHHHVALPSPLIRGSELTALLFAHDPSLPPLDTPFGKVIPTQAIGITADEEGLLAEWSAERFIELLRQAFPSLETKPDRRSWLQDPQIGPMMREAAWREGSSLTGVAAAHVFFYVQEGRYLVELGPAEFASVNIPRILRGRTRLGRPFTISGSTQQIEFQQADVSSCTLEDSKLVVHLHEEARAALEHELLSLPAGVEWSSPHAPSLTIKLVE